MDHMNSTCAVTLDNFTQNNQECINQISCEPQHWITFTKSISGQLWRVNALLVVNAILTAAIVVIGAYCQRFRHHPFTRLVFLGATTLFMPIISYVVSTSASYNSYTSRNTFPYESGLVASCEYHFFHQELVIIWAFLVQMAVINTSIIVATDDRGGQSIAPPFQLLVQGVWTFYLGYFDYISSVPFSVLGAKMVFKYYAFKKARRSFALGRNPRLISGYMLQLQLQEESQHGEPPPLLVMGEEGRKVEKQPHGYVFKDDVRANNTSFVTIDRIWQLDSMLPMSSPHIKDLCLSFAFFKLLRCRFAGYELSNDGSLATQNFFWYLLLEDGGHARAFGVVADELSFLHDYYNTSLPVSYSKGWLPILSVFLSFVCIVYCILVARLPVLDRLKRKVGQIHCFVWCTWKRLANPLRPTAFEFGSLLFDLVPVYLLVILVVMSEVRDISSYICSNWTKVALICHYVSRPSSPPRMHRWAAFLLNCSCKQMKHWDEKIGQCSVLMLHQRTALFVLLRLLLHLPERTRKVKKVSPAVKVCIIDALRRCNGSGCQLSKGTSSLCQIHQAGESLLWACNGKGTSDVILAWHIATDILKMRYPLQQDGQDPSSISDHKIAATHLSRYCAYLMTTHPKLLPDDDAWSKSLYKAVKKDAARVLAGCHVRVAGSSSSTPPTPEVTVQMLVRVLERESKHEVLKNGVKLGNQLVEMRESEETKWKLLAGFWSEMILYVAPSDNLKGHSEAIARGGELITLLWAMLTHAGIVNRTVGGTGGTPSASGDTM